MDPDDLLSQLGTKVLAIGSELTEQQIATLLRIEAARSRTEIGAILIDTWRRQVEQDRKMRKLYATWFLIAILCESALANVYFLLIGRGLLMIPAWTANVFFGAVFGQISAGAIAIAAYLFPRGGADPPTAVFRELNTIAETRES